MSNKFNFLLLPFICFQLCFLISFSGFGSPLEAEKFFYAYDLPFDTDEAILYDFKPSKFKPGKKIQLNAEPNEGYRFVSWTLGGRVVSTKPIYEFTMPSRNIVVKANFAPISSLPVVESPPSPESENAPSPNILLHGLVSFYEMNDNASGILRDSRGGIHGRNYSINNVSGFTGNGNRYNGLRSFSNVAHHKNHNFASQFTILVDIFRTGPGQNGTSIILGKTFSSTWAENQSYSIGLTRDNRIRIRTNTKVLNDWISSQTVPENIWVRIIATYKSGEGYRLYLNKMEVERSPVFSGRIHPSNRELTIGAATSLNNAAAGRRFSGIIDNLGLWNRQLRYNEIRLLMTQRLSYPDMLQGNQGMRIGEGDLDNMEDESVAWNADELLINREEQDPEDVRLNFKLAPNPVSDNLNIVLQNLDARYQYEIRIVSMLGNVARTFQAYPEGSVISLDLADLDNGVYLLHLIGEGNSISSKKFIKK
jgi:hypothetical protein